MNLWRVAIDQRTGTPGGSPQPVTSSFTGIGYARFTADARRVAVMAYSQSFELSLAPFDPSGGGKVGPAIPVRSPSLGWCSPSPAADWLACTSRGAQEDIVLMRPDGSETVRLLDDAWKDRNATWAPDGSRIAFMSTRSGQWELWSLRRDGSDLRQMTDLRAGVATAVWAPDGRQALTPSSTRPPFGLWFFDPSTLATRQTATFVEASAGKSFSPEWWSPDRRLVAGSLLDGAGNPERLAVWDVAARAARPLQVLTPSSGQFNYVIAGWLPDSRRFLAVSETGLVLVDSATGEATRVQTPVVSRYQLANGGRTLMTEDLRFDADVWLMEARR